MAEYRINAGDLRTTITLQVPTIGTDAGGAQRPAYANAPVQPVVRAKWVNAHGQENTSNAVQSVQRATVTIRHRDDVATTWRVVKSDEPWNIISIDAVQDRRRWIEMVVERVKGTV
jgi:head-tail adaptor